MAEPQDKPAIDRNAPACPACDGRGYEDNPNPRMSPLWCFKCEGTGHADAGIAHVVRYRRGDKIVAEWQAHG